MKRSLYANPNIPAHLHEKMKQLAKEKGKTIISEYEDALSFWIANERQKILLADSQLEKILVEKLTKMENRLADLTARVGMDVSISLMGLLHLMNHELSIPEEVLYQELRPRAAKYFSRPLKPKKGDRS